MASTGRNPWIVLGLPEGASYEMARRAFRRRAAQTHPDHGGDHGSFLAVQAAWDELRPLLAARPARRLNPYGSLIATTPAGRDLLETPRRPPAADIRDLHAGDPALDFAEVLERELDRLTAA